MTGNTKVWRAPLAGLASLAMLATMGVAAGTASAASFNAGDDTKISVSIEGVSITKPVYKGETYADIIADNGGQVNKSWTDADGFAGYTDGDSFVDLRSVAKDGAELKALKAANPATDLSVKFVKEGESEPFTYVNTSVDNGKVSVASQLKPYDVADGEILDWDNATYAIDNTTTKGQKFAFDTAIAVKGGNNITVTVPTKDADLLTFDNTPYAADSEGASKYDVVYPGALADGAGDGWKLTVEVAKPDQHSTDGKHTYDPSAVADGLTVNMKSSSDKDVYGFTGFVDDNGDPFTASYSWAGNGHVSPVVKKANKVQFFDGDKELKDLQQAVLTGKTVTEPKYDRGDGSTLVGWYTTAGDQWDFEKDKVSGDTKLYAKFVDNGSYKVTYKFNDGKTADKTETYLAKQVLPEPENPARDGYVFAGWYEDNGNGKLDASDVKFDRFGQALAGGSSTVLIAKWLSADDDTLAAAFKYVDGSKEDNNAVYDNVFTAASFKEYVKTYQAVQAEYAKAQNEAEAAGTQIPAATFSDLLSKLVAGWKKLEFAHSGGLTSETVVHRLAKGNDHFYTQDQDEVIGLTSPLLGGTWGDEGRLFQTAPKDAKEYGNLESFDAAVKAAGVGQDAEDTLYAVAKPILTPVTRLYNTRNGDHVWTVDQNEADYLSAQPEWNNEGDAFYVPTYTGSQAVTRLSKGNRHLLSTDSNEVKVLVKDGWTNEGTAFKAY